MDRSIVQTLSGLIPAFNGPLPTGLVELATSLLVQSRSKARSLKADEEIARAYACAHLACERLKQSLELPKIQPRPPCAPKVYQKLYRFLDTTLLAGTRRSTRAPVAKRVESALKSSPPKPKTPSKAIAFEQANPRTRASRPVTTVIEVPEWVMPAIRLVCRKLGAPSAPHHIFAGVSSILALPQMHEPKANQRSRNPLKNLSALIMVIFLIVYARLAAVKTPPDIFLKQKTVGFEVLRDCLGEEAAEESTSNDTDFNELIIATKNKGWTEMDWFENITPGAGLGLVNAGDEEAEVDSNNRGVIQDESGLVFQDYDEQERNFLQAGLGTMMQDKVDYLSERRRHKYQEWKKGILLQIEELRKADEET